MAYSIITGASKGIGKALALECARKERNLILVSLPKEGLEKYGSFLADTYGVDVEVYETDLTAHGAVNELFDWCRTKDLNVDMLINNAGVGSQGSFEFSSPNEFQTMIKLNTESLVSMCWNAIPFLKEHEQSYILNVGSISSFTAVPYKAVYAATKSFILSFSNSLCYELSDSGISVSCLCPGPTITSEEQIGKVREQGFKAKAIMSRTHRVARRAIDGLLNHKRVIVPGWGNIFFTYLARFLPVKLKLALAGSTFSDSSFNHQHSYDALKD